MRCKEGERFRAAYIELVKEWPDWVIGSETKAQAPIVARGF
jgi:hypothetical protein